MKVVRNFPSTCELQAALRRSRRNCSLLHSVRPGLKQRRATSGTDSPLRNKAFQSGHCFQSRIGYSDVFSNACEPCGTPVTCVRSSQGAAACHKRHSHNSTEDDSDPGPEHTGTQMSQAWRCACPKDRSPVERAPCFTAQCTEETRNRRYLMRCTFWEPCSDCGPSVSASGCSN
jgi:hypothetical protein